MVKVFDTVTLGKRSVSADPVSGMIVASLIGAGGAAYSANQAADAQREAQERADKARREAEERARQQAADARPEGESATLLPGTTGQDDDIGSFGEFLTPKRKTAALGGTGTTSGVTGGSTGTGLGFNV